MRIGGTVVELRPSLATLAAAVLLLLLLLLVFGSRSQGEQEIEHVRREDLARLYAEKGERGADRGGRRKGIGF